MYVLNYEEYCRLDEVMTRVIQVHGRGNFPTLEVQPMKFIKLLTAFLNQQEDLQVISCRLNGSAASYVLQDQELYIKDGPAKPYNDLDIIINVKMTSLDNFTMVKDSVLLTLMKFLPSDSHKEKITSNNMKEAYVRKLVKVTDNGEFWSLISLTNHNGRNIELKFVDTMKRQFEFSVDSLQIIFDSYLTFLEGAVELEKPPLISFPSVQVESVYGDVEEVRYHLTHRLIATHHPEDIRGGGLLKYCSLLTGDYRLVSSEIYEMEKYMCDRFFTDYNEVKAQQLKIEAHLKNHCLDDKDKRYKYIRILYGIVEKTGVPNYASSLQMIHGILVEAYKQIVSYRRQQSVLYTTPLYVQQFVHHRSYPVPYSYKPEAHKEGPSVIQYHPPLFIINNVYMR